jgi:hypothetical protein
MSRSLTWILMAFLAEMVAVAVGVTIWRSESWAAFADLSEARWKGLIASTAALAFCPAWLALGWWRLQRRIVAQQPSVTEDRRRFQRTSLLVVALFIVGIQAWLAAGVVTGVPPGGEFALRLILALVGVFLALVGNFQAKLGPPTGPDAPDPGLWTRSMLRHGWTAVLGGLLIVAGAALLPVGLIFWAMVVVVAVLAFSARQNVRALLRHRS